MLEAELPQYTWKHGCYNILHYIISINMCYSRNFFANVHNKIHYFSNNFSYLLLPFYYEIINSRMLTQSEQLSSHCKVLSLNKLRKKASSIMIQKLKTIHTNTILKINSNMNITLNISLSQIQYRNNSIWDCWITLFISGGYT